MVKAYVTMTALHKQALPLKPTPVKLALAVKAYLPRIEPALKHAQASMMPPYAAHGVKP